MRWTAKMAYLRCACCGRTRRAGETHWTPTDRVHFSRSLGPWMDA